METILLRIVDVLFAASLCSLIFIPLIVRFILSGYLFSLYFRGGQSFLDITSKTGVTEIFLKIKLVLRD